MEKQEYLVRQMVTCGCQEKCLAGIAMQRELDDEVRVAPFVSVLNTESMTRLGETIIQFVTLLSLILTAGGVSVRSLERTTIRVMMTKV